MKYFIILILSILSTHQGISQTYQLKTKKQQLEWTGKAAFKAYSLTGTLEVEKGFVELQNNEITRLEIIVNMKSLDHKNADLKSHLRNEDFFEVNTYKKATFILTKPANISNGKATLYGKMTIKNNTNPETIEVVFTKENDQIIVSLNHEMDRTAYNVKYNSPSFFKSLKQNAIADKFSLKGNLRFKASN